MGANIVLLGLVHAIRVVVVVVTMPFLMSFLVGPVAPTVAKASMSMVAGDYAVLIVCGVAGYAMARLVRIPAAAMLWPLAFSAAAHMWPLTQSSPPPGMISGVQIVLGAYIGARFGSVHWRDFRNALMHGLIWACGLMAIAMGFAWTCAWATDFRLAQLLLAFAPGGLAEMGLLTLALGIDVALVTTCHVVRIMLVYCIVPFASRGTRKVPPNVKDNGLSDD
jgi:membrane AbrB-like protein